MKQRIKTSNLAVRDDEGNLLFKMQVNITEIDLTRIKAIRNVTADYTLHPTKV